MLPPPAPERPLMLDPAEPVVSSPYTSSKASRSVLLMGGMSLPEHAAMSAAAIPETPHTVPSPQRCLIMILAFLLKSEV